MSKVHTVPKVLTIDPSGHDGSTGRPAGVVAADARAMLAERKRRLAAKSQCPVA